jgi:predicted nuclease of restriction endonuclease-like (RecB) superfamily
MAGKDKKYIKFVAELKIQILQSRYHAVKLVNNEILLLYYATGKSITEKLKRENWGNAVIEKLSEDLQKALPGLRGFSSKNLRNMRQFYETYSTVEIWQSATAKSEISASKAIWQSATAKSEISASKAIWQSTTAKSEIASAPAIKLKKQFIKKIFISLSFTHHILLLNKCRDLKERMFYMELSVANQWSVSLLQHQLDNNLYKRKGKLINNFKQTITAKLYSHALESFKDEYLLDFININEDDNERELETQVINNIKKFVLSLGTGFSYIGNQYRLIAGGEEFFSDLLFFNRLLQCLVVIELKSGKFKPEHAGKLNFYLNLLDEKVKLLHENNSIGIILCREKNNAVVEYAFKNIDKAMGVATYKTSKLPPSRYRKILPDAESLKKFLKK